MLREARKVYRLVLEPSGSFERCHVDKEAIAHIGPLHALERGVDFLNGDHLLLGQDAHPRSEVHHLLRLGVSAGPGSSLNQSETLPKEPTRELKLVTSLREKLCLADATLFWH